MATSPTVQFGHWPAGKPRQLPLHRTPGAGSRAGHAGELRWQVEGRIEDVPPGSIFFTLPWETHGSVRPVEPGCELFFVVLRVDHTERKEDASLRPSRRGRFSGHAATHGHAPSRVEPHPARTLAFPPAVGLSPTTARHVRSAVLTAPRRCWPAGAVLTTIVPKLVAELARPDSSADAVAASTRLLLVELGRTLARPAGPPPPPAARRVKQFVAQLADECGRPWTLAAMASACGLGRSRFAAVLKQLTGDTPTMALNRLRAARAQGLLADTDQPITGVAAAFGFNSSQHICAVFKAYSGTTARTYRAQAARNV